MTNQFLTLPVFVQTNVITAASLRKMGGQQPESGARASIEPEVSANYKATRGWQFNLVGSLCVNVTRGGMQRPGLGVKRIAIRVTPRTDYRFSTLPVFTQTEPMATRRLQATPKHGEAICCEVPQSSGKRIGRQFELGISIRCRVVSGQDSAVKLDAVRFCEVARDNRNRHQNRKDRTAGETAARYRTLTFNADTGRIGGGQFNFARGSTESGSAVPTVGEHSRQKRICRSRVSVRPSRKPFDTQTIKLK